jgi:hypothetical protein
VRREPERRPEPGEDLGVEKRADVLLETLGEHDAVEQVPLGGVGEVEGAGAPVPDQ